MTIIRAECLYSGSCNENAGPCDGEVTWYYEGTNADEGTISVPLCDKHYYFYNDLEIAVIDQPKTAVWFKPSKDVDNSPPPIFDAEELFRIKP